MVDDIDVDFLASEVRSKVIDDHNLDDLHKMGVLTACQGKASETEVSESFSEYARNHRLVGISTVTYDISDFVGHIKTLESVARHMAAKLRTLPGRQASNEEHRIQNRFRSLAQPSNSLAKVEAVAWFEEEILENFPAYKVSGSPSWLFEGDNGDARTILSSLKNYMLPCRLGLPSPILWGAPPYRYPRGIEFIGFAFAGNTVGIPRRPTALDGDYDSVKKIWIPGGHTQPLPHGPQCMKDEGGLAESVSEPIDLELGISHTYIFRN